jgi:peptide/nickel transport system permease protein
VSDLTAELGGRAAAIRPGQRLARTMWRRRTALVGLAGLALVALVALCAPWLVPQPPNALDTSNILAPPVWAGGTAEHPFGTDTLGRDVLSRLIYGARNSAVISVGAMLIGATLGLITGLAAGFFGRVVDATIMRAGDIQLALPFILIAIVILGVMPDREPIHLILVLGVPTWIVYARVVRSRTLAERERDHVRAAKVIGASPLRRMVRYVLPQVWTVVPAIALIDLGFLVIMESTLSFLGFGLTPPAVSWGQVLAEGRQAMAVSPWLPVLPGLAIMVTVLSLNLAADGATGVTLTPHRRAVTRRQGHEPSRGGARALSPAREEPGGPGETVLHVRDLMVEFPVSDQRVVRAVRGVSFDVGRGRILGVVGESGSGKSVTAYALIRLLSPPGRITGGRAVFDGVDLTTAPESTLRRLRGGRIGMIFQNPAGSLNPVLTVGYQLIEAIRTHRGVDRDQARQLTEAAFRQVGFGDPAHVMRQYPFRLSGGQNQRVMIAMTMVVEPELLIADEPTTALDVTTQAQVLDHLRQIRDEHRVSIVLISHDIELIGEIADDVVVMYAGEVCESGPAVPVLREPRHPYTRALLTAVPRIDTGLAGELQPIPGELPDPARESVGCPFAGRCPAVMPVCRRERPVPVPLGQGRSAACHLHARHHAAVPAEHP